MQAGAFGFTRRTAMDFIALDVETPNSKNDGICSIGTLLMTDDRITDEWYTLVDPEDIFEDFNMSIHHIRPQDVAGAPKFEEVWARIADEISNRIVIAHNAEFDLTVLSKALENRGIERPDMRYICTVTLGRKIHYGGSNVKGDLVLSNLARTLGVELEKHHNALFDTRACAGIFLRLHEMYEFSSSDYVRRFRYPKPKREFCGSGTARGRRRK